MVNKTDYKAKISDTDETYFTTSKYNKKKRYKDKKKKRLVNKSNISDLVKNSGLNTKLTTLTAKAN